MKRKQDRGGRREWEEDLPTYRRRLGHHGENFSHQLDIRGWGNGKRGLPRHQPAPVLVELVLSPRASIRGHGSHPMDISVTRNRNQRPGQQARSKTRWLQSPDYRLHKADGRKLKLRLRTCGNHGASQVRKEVLKRSYKCAQTGAGAAVRCCSSPSLGGQPPELLPHRHHPTKASLLLHRPQSGSSTQKASR